MGRIAGGVRAIKLEDDDEVVSMELVQPDEELLVVTTNGYGKRTPVKEYKVQARGGKGLLTYDKSKFKKTGRLVGAIVVDDDDEVTADQFRRHYHPHQSKRSFQAGKSDPGSKDHAD